MAGVWTRESPWLTTFFYALSHTVFLGALPALFVLTSNERASSYWISVPSVVAFILSFIWLKPRVDALLSLQAVLIPRDLTVADVIVRDLGPRDQVWRLSVTFLGADAASCGSFIMIGLWTARQLAGSDWGLGLMGVGVAALAGTTLALFRALPRYEREARRALRRYMDSKNAADLELAAELLAGHISKWSTSAEHALRAERQEM